jgi:hypothetical protein
MPTILMKKRPKKKVALALHHSLVSRVESSLVGHFGPISDIHRSPFFPDIILSVGGWSFHVWKEKINVLIA